VKWLKTDLPRTAFDQDVLYSFGALMTVCKIERNEAESRVRAIVEGKAIPLPTPGWETVNEATAIELQDVETFAKDQIQQFIARKFRGHKLAELVESVLKAQGYVTLRMAPGPDGGVDILAGSGPMGFDSPRVCVQVKSSDSAVDVGVLRELRGTMEANHAEQGLLVSWGGFKTSVSREAVPAFFKIRLWDQGELLRQLLDNYDRLPETLKADLLLKRIWALAPEEETE
jgi:restriction system protein